MQAYIHGLPSTNSKTGNASFVGALNVHRVDPTADKFVSDESSSTFELDIKTGKTSSGETVATLQKSNVNGRKLDVQDMVCTVVASGHAQSCDPAKMIACPGGGGAASCTNGQWACPPMPHR
jgi:hypothetical protein